MNTTQLSETANALVAPGKGILAADESAPTIAKRLESIHVESTADTRRAWRELLFSTPGVGESISGVILFDETLRQKGSDGRPMVAQLQAQGMIPGVKVDTGAKALPRFPDETVTEGLDGLRARLAEYGDLGARFTKWRAVIRIGADIPSAACINVNAHALARFAALSQEAGLTPIVEPEVVMDGDHSIDRCFQATEGALQRVFQALYEQGVFLEGILLKPNMVLSGKDAADRAGPEQVAEATVRCFRRAVPAAVPGAVFLSGGQSDEEATLNLNALNQLAADAPWQLSFSYGRGLQATPLNVWGGKAENVARAQATFAHRASVTAAARRGVYTTAMEKEPSGVS